MTTVAPDVMTRMPQTATFSVILPVMIHESWQKAMTVAAIEVMKATTKLPYELIIVESKSKEFYLYPGATTILTAKKATYVKDFNEGLDYASGDYVIQMGNDIFTRQGWLEALLECFETYPDCGAASLGTHEGGGGGRS